MNKLKDTYNADFSQGNRKREVIPIGCEKNNPNYPPKPKKKNELMYYRQPHKCVVGILSCDVWSLLKVHVYI